MKHGWQAKRLSDVCEIIMGTSPPGETYNTTGEGVPLINGPVEFSRGSFGKTVRTKFTTAPNKLCKENDLILCVRGSTTGKMNIAGFDACIGRGVAAIRAKEYQPWINHFISSKTEDIFRLGTGATFPNISTAALAGLTLHMPPLAEQRRIVGILDEAFEGLATAKANAEQNLQNARALFESHLQAVFTQRGHGWDTQPLLSLCSMFVDSAHRTPKYQDDGIPALRPRDVVNGKLNFDGAQRVSEHEYEIQSKRYKPRASDIVYSRELSYGWAAMLPKSPQICLSQGMCIFRPNGELDGNYLLYVLNSPVGREQAQRVAVGAAHPHINLSDIKAYQIPFPSLDVQKEITKRFDSLAAETQRLESLYQRKLAALDELKKSLLHRAFSGQL